MLGCHQRSARRLLRYGDEDIPAMRMAYVNRLSHATATPVAALLGKVNPCGSISNNLHALNSAVGLNEFRMAAAVVAQMAARCQFGAHLHADYGVNHNQSFSPFRLWLDVCDLEAPDVKHKLVAERSRDLGWQLQYFHPLHGKVFEGKFTETNFDRLVKQIKMASNANKKHRK